MSNGAFFEDEVSAHTFSLGGNVFLTAEFFRGTLNIHIRQFCKYGRKLYPTTKRVCLPSADFIELTSYGSLPEVLTIGNLQVARTFLLDYEFERASSRITLDYGQFDRLFSIRSDVLTSIVQLTYARVDFKALVMAVSTLREGLAPTVASVERLFYLLKEAFSDHIGDHQRVLEIFQESAVKADFASIAKDFYSRLDEPLLCSLTPEFLDDVNFFELYHEILKTCL